MTQTLLLSPGTTALGQQLLDERAIFVGPDTIEVSTEADSLAANGFAREDGPDLVLLDGPGLKEVLRQNSSSPNGGD